MVGAAEIFVACFSTRAAYFATFGLIRASGPERPNAATTFPSAPQTGAAIPHTPSRHSPWFTAYRCALTWRDSRSIAASVAFVRFVNDTAAAPTRAISCDGCQARRALPVAVA